ncbi:hypothetical protein HYT24_00685 [Candidatus Pacearchaeota archaeon]|nr:hypothetical protein [Candidatus Pacearchaeota archaeon]
MSEIEFIKKDSKKHKSKKYYFKWALFLMFLGIFALIIYTSFFGGFDFTGSVISGGGDIISGTTSGKSIDFSSSTTVPELTLTGSFEKVEVRGGAESYLQVGDQKFFLGDSKNNYIVFRNYEGEIIFDSGKISKLNGKAVETTINGILVTPQTKETSKINLQTPINYNMLILINEVQIKRATYVTSGTINVGNGKNAINIQEEQVTITGFKGNLEAINGKLNLAGKIQGFDVAGETNIHIGS